MSDATKTNFIAEDNVAQLEIIIAEYERTIKLLKEQRLILQHMSEALTIISTDPNRHHKCRRIRPMAEFLYQKEEDAEIQRRQLTLRGLDSGSMALYKASFDALITGLPKFLEAQPDRRNLIITKIGDYTKDAITEFEHGFSVSHFEPPSNNITANQEKRPVKRRRMAPTRRPNPGRPEPSRISSHISMSSTLAPMAESVVPNQQNQIHAERVNRAELDSQPENLFPTPWQDSNMASSEGECRTNDAYCQPGWFTRGLAGDIPVLEVDDVSEQTLNQPPSFLQTWSPSQWDRLCYSSLGNDSPIS
ncbi:unnamed protein product [Clonostachys chloroleuca]|uniref:Uncharacterized protein n=1 Tax=Clonostachys chloroleuca TaxID=1926264 RepID=A0AA35QG72_9HYPO|nr:unnamed protein product [Clonostachys chloroleuca]